jgi:hypothetical protein
MTRTPEQCEDLTDAEWLFLRWVLGEGSADEPPRGADMGDLVGKGYMECVRNDGHGLGKWRVTIKGRRAMRCS